jgi:hypothetical protein
VWALARDLARRLAARRPDLITAEHRKAKRPAGHVLLAYNQNARGRTMASVYSVRLRAGAAGFPKTPPGSTNPSGTASGGKLVVPLHGDLSFDGPDGKLPAP